MDMSDATARIAAAAEEAIYSSGSLVNATERLEIAAAQAPTMRRSDDGTVKVVYTPHGVCRGCGCSDERACPGGCVWAEPNLCSRCFLGRPRPRPQRTTRRL
jgi:hypothetical protein